MCCRKFGLFLAFCIVLATQLPAAAQELLRPPGAHAPQVFQAVDNSLVGSLRQEMDALQRRVDEQNRQIEQLLQSSPPSPRTFPDAELNRIQTTPAGSDGPIRQVYYQIRERPELDVPLLTGPPPAAEAPGQRFAVGYDGGFFIRPTEENEDEYPFALKINGRTQFRPIAFDDMGNSPRGNEFDFELERNRLVFSGYAFDPNLIYYIQLDGDSDDEQFVEFIDYYIIYQFREEFGVRAGIWKLPFTKQDTVSSARLQFVDRSIADEMFNIDRSQGVSVLGTLRETFHYELAVINGFNTDNAVFNRQGDLDDNPAYAGRVYWDPWDDFGKSESDLEHHEEPAVRIGGGLAFSEVEPLGFREMREFRLIDSGRVVDVVPGANDGFSALIGAVDVSYKHCGFSLNTEWFARRLFSFENSPVDAIDAYGFYIQSGYFLVPKKFEIAARWSRVWGDRFPGHSRKSADEIGGAINYYIIGHDLKLSFSAIHLNGAPRFSDTTAIQLGDDGMQYMGQLQFAF